MNGLLMGKYETILSIQSVTARMSEYLDHHERSFYQRASAGPEKHKSQKWTGWISVEGPTANLNVQQVPIVPPMPMR